MHKPGPAADADPHLMMMMMMMMILRYRRQRGFSVSGQTMWNFPPSTSVTALSQLCALLKTVLFCGACETPSKRRP